MIEIRIRPGERRIQSSPVGLQLVDEFAGGPVAVRSIPDPGDIPVAPPLGKVEATIDLQVGAAWVPLDVKPIRTLSGLLVYPGLGRHPFPVNGEPKRHFRIRLKAEYYRVLYPPGMDAFEFDAPAFNDGAPPPKPTRVPAFLLPAPNYPFPAETPVLRGQVVASLALMQPVVDAEVADDNRQKVLTDERGEYALPLRLAVRGTVIPIDVSKGSATKAINVKFPDDLAKSKIIVFP